MGKIDVILPNYNKKEYIKECIESLVCQTFEDWRCIVVDGQSDDGSWEIIQKYARSDDRFELHRPGRLGLYPSWNYGLETVRSPYFTFLTSDDVWHPSWLESAVRTLESHGSPPAVSARPLYIDASSNVIGTPSLALLADDLMQEHALTTEVGGAAVQCRPGPLQAALVYVLGAVPITMHSLVMRRELAEMRFAEDVGTIADREWYLRMGLHGDVWYLRDSEVYLRRYDEQATSVTQRNRDQLAASVRTILDRNAGALRASLNVSSDTFRRIDDVVRRMFAFLYTRPSFSQLRAEPISALRRLLQATRKYPRLLSLEILSVLLGKRKYSTQRRVEAFSELVKHTRFPTES